MGYPLIILGAGASFDFLDLEGFSGKEQDNLGAWRPPLTNQLFDGTRFQDFLEKYPEMNEMASYIMARIRKQNEGISFENILSKLFSEDIKNNPELHKSFMALLFYLSDLLGNVSRNYYRPVNNLHILMHVIKQSGGKAVFVNYNYDLLLEKVLNKSDVAKVNELITGDFPVIKVHGGYNWYVKRLVSIFSDKTCYELSLMAADKIFEKTENVKYELEIQNNHNPKDIKPKMTQQEEGYTYHPALALPVLNKANYVCLDAHIELLKEELKKIDRVIIIGWKAADQFVLNLLLEEMNKRAIPLAYIGGKDAIDTVKGLNKTFLNSAKLIAGHGFSQFASSSSVEDFLRKDAADLIKS